MLKGLLLKLFKRNDDVDLGAVSLMIHLKEGVDREKAENALKSRGIHPYTYLAASETFFCTAPNRCMKLFLT